MFEQNRIGRAFSRAASTYQQRSVVQERVAQDLISLIQSAQAVALQGSSFVAEEDLATSSQHVSRSFFELGCGTGLLTRLLLKQYPENEIDALDLSPEMIGVAKQLCVEDPNVNFFVGDLSSFSANKRYALVASSSALHWFRDLESVFNQLRSLLDRHGLFAFSLMIDGTLSELHELRRELFPAKIPIRSLPTDESVLRDLEACGFRICNHQVHTYKQYFADGTAMLKAIKELGVTNGPFSHSQSFLSRGELRLLAQTYNDRFGVQDLGVVATYRVGFYVACV